MGDWPGKAIELPNHDSIEAPAVSIGHEAIELRSLLFASGNGLVANVTDLSHLSENNPIDVEQLDNCGHVFRKCPMPSCCDLATPLETCAFLRPIWANHLGKRSSFNCKRRRRIGSGARGRKQLFRF
jgi:hypothetical protein